MTNSDRRPIVGITTPARQTKWANWDLNAIVLPTTYPKIIRKCGGNPLLIPPGGDASILDCLDALVVAGGPDIDPELYGQVVGEFTDEIYPEQDASEIALIKGAIERDIPLLGVCRGFQMICILAGGSLYQHLPETQGFEDHGGWNGVVSEHGVDLLAASHLCKILGKSVTANSTHHQGVSDAGSLVISGYSSHDGLIEAVEMPDRKFCIGVQWHPERIGHHELYTALIDAARSS